MRENALYPHAQGTCPQLHVPNERRMVVLILWSGGFVTSCVTVYMTFSVLHPMTAHQELRPLPSSVAGKSATDSFVLGILQMISGPQK